MSALAGARPLLRARAAARPGADPGLRRCCSSCWSSDRGASSKGLYPTPPTRAAYVAHRRGQPRPDRDASARRARSTRSAADVAWQLGGFGAAFVALMSMLIVGRHTRAEEESGRSRADRRGARSARFAPRRGRAARGRAADVAASALLVGRSRCSAIGQPAAGSFALGASLGRRRARVRRRRRGRGPGHREHPRRRTGSPAPCSAPRTCCARRATSATATLSWLSPIGWGQAMRPFAGERWWPLALLLVVAAALVAGAVALRARRDVGAGLVAAAARAARGGPRAPPPARARAAAPARRAASAGALGAVLQRRLDRR